jgi:hypothetical protein
MAIIINAVMAKQVIGFMLNLLRKNKKRKLDMMQISPMIR